MVDTVTATLPIAVVWAVLYGGVDGLNGGRGRRVFVAWSGAGAVAGMVTALLRLTTNWIGWEASLLAILPLVLGLGAAVLVWAWFADPAGGGQRWGTIAAAAWGGVLVFLGLSDAFVLVKGATVSGAVVLTSDAVLKAAGFLIGLGLVAVTAWALHRAGAGSSLPARRVGLAAGVAVYMAAQLTVLLRISVARRLVDVSPEVFAVAVWLVNHEWVFTAGVLMAALVPVAAALRVRRTLGEPANAAEARLVRAAVRSRRRFLAASAASLGLVAVTLTVGRRVADAVVELSGPEPFEQDDERVWVRLAVLDDGHLHRFEYMTDGGTRVRFFAIRKAPGAFVAVLDACEICGPSGYFERDAMVICKMCGVAMNIATIGFPGGCNPIPIDHEVAGGRLSVTRSTLDARAAIFA
ncbi:MAG: DUF2318 domain-containing protein [Nigerium sp.]|nr:DUF2318 domain-containing protein [Nigerium sp.]